MEILVPVWPTPPSSRPPKARLHEIHGARIALVDDNLDIAFTTHLESLLSLQHGAKVERFVKPSGTAPSPPELIESAATAQAAVVGIGL
jgi:hypothetical protein